MDTFNKDEAKAKFLEIARSKPALKGLLDSQILDGLNIYQNLAVEYATFNNDRAYQESFLSTALNRSSVLAGAHDRNYVPIKAAPAKGAMRIENKSGAQISIPEGVIFLSDDQMPYITEFPIIIDDGNNALISVKQESIKELAYTMENEEPFTEYLVDAETSSVVSAISVFVDKVEWSQTKLFHNTDSESLVWHEAYSPSDEIIIRFGNGIFGKIPSKDSDIKILLKITNGDTELMPNEEMFLSSESELTFTDVSFYSGTVINGGRNSEETESIRRNALYYFQYDEKREWWSDYEFFLKQEFPELLFVKCWGEQQQEKMDGERKAENINVIHFSAYSKETPEVHLDCLSKLEEMPEYNRFFRHKPYEDKKFTFSIEGKVVRDITIDSARTGIMLEISKHYGKGSTTRKESALLRDLYRIMNASGFFESQEDVFITLSGSTKPVNLYDLISVDTENSTLDLSYD